MRYQCTAYKDADTLLDRPLWSVTVDDERDVSNLIRIGADVHVGYVVVSIPSWWERIVDLIPDAPTPTSRRVGAALGVLALLAVFGFAGWLETTIH